MPPSSLTLPTMQRSYTLKLTGEEENWRTILWATHEALNNGTQSFCNWFLTFRGGLPAALANLDPKATPEKLKHRRILLALSWLSVEDGEGVPDAKFHIEAANKKGRLSALQSILEHQQVPSDEITEWLTDCETSLSASIRDGAVWVNRYQIFRDLDITVSYDDIIDFLFNSNNKNAQFFSLEDYFALPLAREGESDTDSEDNTSSSKEEKPKELAQKALGWLCDHYGEGKKADNTLLARTYQAILEAITPITSDCKQAEFMETILRHCSDLPLPSQDWSGIFSLLNAPGRESSSKLRLKNSHLLDLVPKDTIEALKKSLQKDVKAAQSKIGSKGRQVYSDKIEQSVQQACRFPYQPSKGKANREMYTVMLDHAARRISQTHSWIKLNEVERFKYEANIAEMATIPTESRKWLDQYCQERTLQLGALEDYTISPNAISGWSNVVDAWSQLNVATEEARQEKVKELQSHPDIKKFGDINLFLSLAADEALCVWQEAGNPTAKILQTYVKAQDAERKKRHYKVPAFCHPDPLRHPVFCDFGKSRPSIRFALLNTDKPQKGQADGLIDPVRGLRLELFTGENVQQVNLKWQSKRFFNEIAKGKPVADEDATSVSRLNRFAQSAAGLNPSGRYTVHHVFQKDTWSGRLQAPRQQLANLARIKTQNLQQFEKLKLQINWFITCSTELQSDGPWYTYVDSLADKTPFLRTNSKGSHVSYSGWPHDLLNKSRGEKAKLLLSRLPGLRVLSLDLGHRYGAACTVWQAMTLTEIQALEPTCDQKQWFEAPYYGKKTLFRRISADTLPDGTSHPAPWARLDREFLIRLQGENEDTRKASCEELKQLNSVLKALHYTEELPQKYAKDKRIDRVIRNAQGVLKQALYRHGSLARIAFNLAENKKIKPGNQVELLSEPADIEMHLVESLALWAELLVTSQWKDASLEELWQHHVGIALDTLPQKPTSEEGYSAQKLKQWKNDLREAIRIVIPKIQSQRPAITQALTAHWKSDEAQLIAALKQIKTVLMPRGEQGKTQSNRHMGGLGVDRIVNLKTLYQLQKAYFGRLYPDGHSTPPSAQFAQTTLDTLEQLRENRVKQLTSRIIEAAMGLGEADKKGPGKRRSEHNGNPRFLPCHAIVIENLRHYRPDALRTRRENRGLMEWAAGKVRTRLEEDCALYGLHLREVSPSFTSRQDSRTGSPGIRCQDMLTKTLLEQAESLEQKPQNKRTPMDQFKLDLISQLRLQQQANHPLPQTVRVPRQGGEIFMSSDVQSPIAGGIQADLNAAANIGLKALLDPDWEGAWWMIPCDTNTGLPDKTKVSGSLALESLQSPLVSMEEEVVAEKSNKSSKKAVKKSKSTMYVFRHGLRESLAGNELHWQRTVPYFKLVEQQVMQRLLKQLKATSAETLRPLPI